MRLWRLAGKRCNVYASGVGYHSPVQVRMINTGDHCRFCPESPPVYFSSIYFFTLIPCTQAYCTLLYTGR
ncbi:hypothetical protein BLX24_10740 [Arsenicibacter rosenii]|uniref:Uncharacterized protein n=1 Tax=Arsenicibacter rosenii TaxID=1750698 RepID=A0A1S2VL19_9BACT|nr:hypothetical protein BLX24_10740 [Arsenicibacter rosenii]